MVKGVLKCQCSEMAVLLEWVVDNHLWNGMYEAISNDMSCIV